MSLAAVERVLLEHFQKAVGPNAAFGPWSRSVNLGPIVNTSAQNQSSEGTVIMCTRIVFCMLVVSLASAAASPAAAQTSGSGKWEIEFHGGGMLPGNPTGGTMSLPHKANCSRVSPPCPPWGQPSTLHGCPPRTTWPAN